MNNKTILLLNPAIDISDTGAKIEAIMTRIKLLMYQFPIGLGFISAYLKQNNCNVIFKDTAIDSENNIFKTIETQKPQIVGISANVLSQANAITLAKKIKKAFPAIKTVAGSIQPTVFPEKFLNNGFDYVIRGDGETPMLKLLQDTPISEIEGLCYKKGNETVINEPNNNPADIDMIPFCDFEGIKLFKNYPAPVGTIFRFPSYPMFATRGCSFKCNFCCNASFNKKHRVRSINNILAEIDLATTKYNAREIHFLDATLTLNKKHTHDLCDALIKRKSKIVWHGWSRVDCLSKDLIFKMAKAGCIGIGFGIESGSEKCLKEISKPLDLNHAANVLKWCDDAGMFIKSSYMYGLPQETVSDMNKTQEFVLNNPHDIATFNRMNIINMLKLDTNTPLESKYRELKKQGKEKELLPIATESEIKKQISYSTLKVFLRFSQVKRYLTRRANIIFVINNMLYTFIYLGKIILNLQKRKTK